MIQHDDSSWSYLELWTSTGNLSCSAIKNKNLMFKKKIEGKATVIVGKEVKKQKNNTSYRRKFQA